MKLMDTTKIEALISDYQFRSKGMIDFGKYSYYAITHHSTSIEGSTLTESQVVNLLEYGKPAANKPFNHHLMVLDHFHALQFVVGEAEKKRKLSPEFLQEISALVMKNTGGVVNTALENYNIASGEFRLGTVRAGTRTFPDYKKVPELVAQLCKETNEKLNTINTFAEKCDLAFHVHFQLASIHPFGDGNGRTSRLLMNFVQVWFGLPLSIVYTQNRIKYINALEAARAKETEQPFFDFMYSQYSKFLKKEIASLK
ncbi:MAG: Fic family protein [Bacteroidota bacterium]|nr:Fic family protein [Bacteroidota bacterium]